jgi:segregation and condensation protein B
MTEQTETILNLSTRLEAILFVASSAVTPSQLADAMGVTTKAVEKALLELETTYQHRGLRLQRHRGRVQLTTAPEMASLVEHFLGLEATSRLSQAALETLAIIAYQQPTTKPLIDSVRGVNCDSVTRNLLRKGLIQEVGRAEGPGRPILYSTTPDFLSYFGINSLHELPPLNLETPPPDEDLGEILETDTEMDPEIS